MVRELWRLSSLDRRLLARAALLLGATRLGLRLLSFRSLLQVLARLSRLGTGSREARTERVVWAVTAASRYVPGADTCLARALVALALLGRRDQPIRLRLGVAPGEKGRLEGHAWIESGERIVIGGSADLSRYAPLPVLGSPPGKVP